MYKRQDVRSAMILAVVQGLTEFLPVSSSGHLVIVRELLNVEEALLSFDVLMHLGTLISVSYTHLDVYKRQLHKS